MASTAGPLGSKNARSPLQSQEVAAFSNALERVYQITDLGSFPSRIFEVIEGLIPGAVITIDEFNPTTGASHSAINRPSPRDKKFFELVPEIAPHEEPVLPPVAAGARDARQISDFLSLRELKRTALDNEIMTPARRCNQIVLPLTIPEHVARVTINRGAPFTDEEVAMAELLGPHIAQARINAQAFADLKAVRDPWKEEVALPAEWGLTPRESEVLHCIIRGKKDAEIAASLGTSVRTVSKQVCTILSKLGVDTRTAAALEAVRWMYQRSRSAA